MATDPAKTTEVLLRAALELLEAESRTIFYDCGSCDSDPDDASDIDISDDMPVDGGSCPLTVGHFRRLRAAVIAMQDTINGK